MSEVIAEHDEYLEDGANVRTPDGDNLVLDFVRGEAAAFRALTLANGGRTFDDPALGLSANDLGIATPFGNVAEVVAPITEANVVAVATALHDFYDNRPGGPFMLFSPWRTPSLAEFGFAPVGHPPLMIRLPGPAAATPPSGISITRATTADALADFERTLIEAYPIAEMQPWVARAFLHPTVLETPWQFFVAYERDEPVATAAAYVSPTNTLIELVSTRDTVRGRGVGAAITAAATTCAPDQPALLIASDLGRNVYAQMGYRSLLRFTLWAGMR